MNNTPKQIYFYIAKNFLIKFLVVTAAISLLIFIINLFDVLDRVKNISDFNWSSSVKMSMLQIPAFLEDISIFIIMLSAMITLFNLSTRSEITMMRSSGLSLWQILLPMISISFLLGVILITVFNPLTIISSNKFNNIEKELIDNNGEFKDILSPKGGVWLKQENINQKDRQIIIRANKVHKNNLKFFGITIWFFNENGKFYQKIDADDMILNESHWELNNITINDEENINKILPAIEIPTNLKKDFITQKIINNFEDIKLFSVYKLPDLINNLKESGFSPRKFIVHYYFLLCKPFLFIAMVLIAAFFSINNIRNKHNILYVTIGIMIGLVLYITPNIVGAFGSSGIIPPFAATWLLTAIFLAVSILLIFEKENI